MNIFVVVHKEFKYTNIFFSTTNAAQTFINHVCKHSPSPDALTHLDDWYVVELQEGIPFKGVITTLDAKQPSLFELST